SSIIIAGWRIEAAACCAYPAALEWRRWLSVLPVSGQAPDSPQKLDRANATRTSLAPFSATSCPSRGRRWWRQSPMELAVQRGAASRPRPRCAVFSMDFATCPRPWKCNAPIHSQGRHDPELAGIGCTFTALVLRGRIAHVLHIGDTRAYRLRDDRLTCLTNDHSREDGAGRPGILYRALGVETEIRLDYAAQPVAQHDRFLAVQRWRARVSDG